MERFNRIDGRKLPLGTQLPQKGLPSDVTIPRGIGTGDLIEQAAASAMLLKEREAVAILLRKNFDEYTKATHNDGTADYVVTGLLQAQNTTLWMLRRYLP